MKPLSIQDALDGLTAKGETYLTSFTHGTLEIGFYRPEGVDPQKPHRRDEVYVVATGSGSFYVDGESTPFQPGDVLFVAAGVEHRFADFSDDFSAWVFFYGPEGGEG